MKFSYLLLPAVLVSGCAASSGPAPEATAESAPVAAASEEEATSEASSAEPEATAELPDFQLTTIDGDRFVLSDHVGRDVIVISFWATWCMPCLAELPHLSELFEEERDNGLMIVAVSMDEPNTQSEVAPTARRLGLEMPVAIDAEQRAVRLYNKGRSAPMTVVIDRTGRIVKAQSGFNPGDEKRLADQVRELLSGS